MTFHPFDILFSINFCPQFCQKAPACWLLVSSSQKCKNQHAPCRQRDFVGELKKYWQFRCIAKLSYRCWFDTIENLWIFHLRFKLFNCLRLSLADPFQLFDFFRLILAPFFKFIDFILEKLQQRQRFVSQLRRFRLWICLHIFRRLLSDYNYYRDFNKYFNRDYDPNLIAT